MSTVSDSSSYSSSLQSLKDSYEAELSQSRTNHRKETEKLEEKSEKQLKSLKEEYQNKLTHEKEAAREEIRKLKDELYDSNGKRFSQDMIERSNGRSELQEYRELLEKESARKIEKIEQNARAKVEKSDQETGNQIEDALRSEKQSHAVETKELRDQLSIYWNEGRDVATEKANARQAVVQSYEGDHIREKENLVQSYDRLIGRMSDHEQDLRNEYGRKLTDAGIEANGKVKKALGLQKEEFTKITKDQRRELDRLEHSYQDTVNSEKSKNAHALGQIMEQNKKDMGRALDEKDKAYGAYLEGNSKRVRSELEAREDIIRDLRTTNDPKKISPALIQKIQSREEGRYHEQVSRLYEDEKANLEALRHKDHEARQEMKSQFENQTRQQSREMRRENDVQRRVTAETYQDMKEHHDAQLTDLQDRATHAIEKIHGSHARALVDEQGLRKEALIEQRESLKEEKERAVEDLTNNQRTQDREWFIRLNDQRREYERKIGLERDQYERQISEQKAEADQRYRELERTAKRVLDEKDRTMDHQAKQQDLTYKEKERFLVEHYESELDKMKRTNAQLITKKS